LSLLSDFEKKLESLFEGFFAKQFKSHVQPIEIAKKISREMNEHKVVGINKIYLPNFFTVYLSPKDKEGLASFEGALVTELSEFIEAHAEKEGSALLGAPQIKIEAKDNLSLGEVRIESSLVEDTPSNSNILPSKEKKRDSLILKGAYLIITEQGKDCALPLTEKITTIGRLESNDISIKDPNVSRIHAEIRTEKDNFFIKDLGSTNGTLLNGKRIVESKLAGGDTIIVGATPIKFLRRSYV